MHISTTFYHSQSWIFDIPVSTTQTILDPPRRRPYNKLVECILFSTYIGCYAVNLKNWKTTLTVCWNISQMMHAWCFFLVEWQRNASLQLQGWPPWNALMLCGFFCPLSSWSLHLDSSPPIHTLCLLEEAEHQVYQAAVRREKHSWWGHKHFISQCIRGLKAHHRSLNRYLATLTGSKLESYIPGVYQSDFLENVAFQWWFIHINDHLSFLKWNGKSNQPVFPDKSNRIPGAKVWDSRFTSHSVFITPIKEKDGHF